MPAPAHFRITHSGVFGPSSAPYEIWSVNLSAGVFGSPAVNRASLASLAAALRPHFVQQFSSLLDSRVRHTRTRVAYVGPTGHVYRDDGGAYLQGDSNGDAACTGNPTSPLQIAFALTLETAFAGPNGRGRIYLPGPVLGTLTDGRISTTVRDGLVSAGRGLVNLHNAALEGMPGAGVISIASAGSVTRGVPAAVRPVTRVSGGRVPDTQRRRRSALKEERAGLGVPS